jgi:hypothetical protein
MPLQSLTRREKREKRKEEREKKRLYTRKASANTGFSSIKSLSTLCQIHFVNTMALPY